MSFWKHKTLDILYQGDPLWRVLLSQLKTQALELSPHFHGGPKPPLEEFERLLGYQRYETYLSQLEDAYSLTDRVFLNKSNRRVTSIVQICEDVSETYARRFGRLGSSASLLLIESKLPTVMTHPSVLMKIFDGLLRAAHRLGTEHGSNLTVQRTKTNSSHVDISIKVSKLRSSNGSSSRLEESLIKFREGKYAQAIHDFGLDIVAALHLGVQLEGKPAVHHAADSTFGIELIIPFDASKEAPKETALPKKFQFLSHSKAMTEKLEQLAKFHGIQMLLINHPKSAAADLPLLFDGSEQETWKAFESTVEDLPNNTHILLSRSDTTLEERLVARDFKRPLIMPLASTRLLYKMTLESSPESRAAQVVARDTLRVLVVDDTETARIIIKDHLELKGHNVVEAYDGSEFINLLHRGERFDLAFCDLNMCHVDGLSAVRAIREHEKVSGERLYIALMTAYHPEDDTQDLSNSGADCLLKKPLHPRDIDFVLDNLDKCRS